MKKLIALLLLASNPLWAATYCMRADGSAANKGAATSCASASTAMSVATHNGQTFSNGDIVNVSDAGGVYRGSTLFTPPSAGVIYNASGSPIFDGGTQANTAGSWTNDLSSQTVTFQPGSGPDDGIYETGGGGGAYNNTNNQISFGTWFQGFDDQNAFIRFPAVSIPIGATVTSATLTVKGYANETSGNVVAKIYANAADNPTAPTSYADAIGRTLTTANTTWTVTGQTTNQSITSPSITSVIQEIVNRGGWSPGNAMVLFVNDSASNPAATAVYVQEQSYNFSPANSAILSVTYTPSTSNLWYLSGISTDPFTFIHDNTLGSGIQGTQPRKSSKGALAAQWDYWYDAPDSRLYVYSSANPTSLATNLEYSVNGVMGTMGASNTTFNGLEFDMAHGQIAALIWAATGVTFTNTRFLYDAQIGIQFNNGSAGTVTNSYFQDWNTQDFGGGFAVMGIQNSGTYSGPIDVANNTFSDIRQNLGSQNAAIDCDDGSWCRNITANTCNNIYVGGCAELFQPWAASHTSTVSNNIATNTYGIPFLLQTPELYGNGTFVFTYNQIKNSDLADTVDTEALRLRSFTGSSTVTAAYNVINGCYAGANLHPGIYLYSAIGAKVYGNTISGCDDGLLLKTASTGNDIRNNVSTANRVYGIDVQDTSTVTTFNHNLFYGNTTANYHGISAGTGDVTTNPLLNANLTLQVGSPAIGSGANIGSTYSLGLLPVSVWPGSVVLGAQAPAWNMGAYVSNASSAFWFGETP